MVPQDLKIVSGGQTGADRAALDWAIENGVPHCGQRPKGRLAQTGQLLHQINFTDLKSLKCDINTA